MTCVTNLILTTAIQDGAWANSDTGSVDILTDYLHQHYQGTHFHDVEIHSGGHMRMSCDVFMAAVDYLDVDAFIEKFHQVPWEKPDEVQLMVRSEGETIFTVYRPTPPQS